MSLIVETITWSSTEIARVLDVGSGEMGFYTYRVEEGTGCVIAGNALEPKLKYNKGQTFADNFVDNPQGPELLRREVEQRFKLASAPASAPGAAPASVVMCLTGANRQILRDNDDGRARLEAFLKKLNEMILDFGLVCTAFFPSGAQEAMFELCATKFVLEHGDLELPKGEGNGFTGTLSAGSGSSQATLCQDSDSSQVHSIPVGNRTPVVSMTVSKELFGEDRPQSRAKAIALLCAGAENAEETQPAWKEDDAVDPSRVELWGELVKACCVEHGLPTEQRGIFVGISAVFYAATEAGCAGVLLGRDDFMTRLDRRCAELLASAEPKGRVISNLVLIRSIAGFVLHSSAQIVCKRTWKMSGGDTELLATWTLGLFLTRAGIVA